MLRALPDSGILVGQRQQLVEDFTAHMAPAGMDRFTAAGMAATWWEESFHELETAANRGWKAVINAWLTTAEASADDKNAPDLADQIAIKLLAGTSTGGPNRPRSRSCPPRCRDQSCRSLRR